MAGPGAAQEAVLSDVVAYVEVWSANGTENYSKTFRNQLVEMGAKVSKTFSKQVTHVVFKDGYPRTWEAAQRRGVKLVSVLWVEKCRTARAHVDEALFPAPSAHEHLPCPVRKKHKCMQPKDFIPKTPENDKRLQKKFEKMSNELQRQKTTLEGDVPVLLFGASGALTYSPVVRTYRGHHSAMERRLQQMKEKRENLSPTSSQVIEESYDDPVNSSCEASLNISHDALCSGDSLAAGPQLPCVGLCGGPEGESQGRTLGGSADAFHGDVLTARSIPPPTSPRCFGQVTPQTPAPAPCPAEGGPGGAGVTPDRKPPKGVPERSGEKWSLSPTLPAAKSHSWGPAQPRGSSAKRKRVSALRGSAPEGMQKRQNSSGGPSAPRGRRLFKSQKSLQLTPRPLFEALDQGASSYDDYFSPENLRERSSGTPRPRCPSPSSPSQFSCRAGLSKRERASVLETADFSCLATSPGFSAEMSCALQGPGRGMWRGSGAPEMLPAAGDAPVPGGSPLSLGDRECAHTSTHPGDNSGTRGGSQETGENGTQKEDAAPRSRATPEGAAGGPARADGLEGSGSDHADLVPPQAESKRRGKDQKPTRTLVMTSLPPEKQSIVLRVVAALKGFSVARDVGESTTHVLAGRALRTLNVLLGLARGCWILSYEWVLWSLELGHWISEEPFELSDSFPAAPLCRQERHLSSGQHRGTLLAGQPTMFISPASDPPRAKLRELVLLCGGRVTGVPRQASIFIGPRQGKKKETITYLSEKWILDSITQHRVCARENYLLQ